MNLRNVILILVAIAAAVVAFYLIQKRYKTEAPAMADKQATMPVEAPKPAEAAPAAPAPMPEPAPAAK